METNLVDTSSSFFKKTIADSNAPVQEKALDALIAYLRAIDVDARRYAFFLLKLFISNLITTMEYIIYRIVTYMFYFLVFKCKESHFL